MSLVCSRCSNVCASIGPCPRCGSPVASAPEASRAATVAPQWQQTSWGRMLIGLILAQGLFYGLRQLLTGILLATTEGEPQELWNDLGRLLLLQALQLFALLVGSVLAGGGQRQGFYLGGLVGVWNGVLSVLLRQNPAQDLNLVALYGQPVLHAAFGAVGGWVGSLIWKPLPEIASLILTSPRKGSCSRRNLPSPARSTWFASSSAAPSPWPARCRQP